jgi:hypothetical protein
VSRSEDLPGHLRPVTVEISRFWPPEVALAVFELVDDLRDRILLLHGDQIRDLLKEQQGHVAPDPRVDVGGGEQSF